MEAKKLTKEDLLIVNPSSSSDAEKNDAAHPKGRSKPRFRPIHPPTSLLNRLKTFMPMIRQANEELKGKRSLKKRRPSSKDLYLSGENDNFGGTRKDLLIVNPSSSSDAEKNDAAHPKGRSKPRFRPIHPPTSLLNRLKTFMPMIRQANEELKEMPVNRVTAGVAMCSVAETSSDSDSDSESDELSDAFTTSKDGEMKESQAIPSNGTIEMEVELLKEGGKLEGNEEESLPVGFRDKREVIASPAAKKTLIEDVTRK